jgi:hypothetical protein
LFPSHRVKSDPTRKPRKNKLSSAARI